MEQKILPCRRNARAYELIPRYGMLLGNMLMQPMRRFGRREYFSGLPVQIISYCSCYGSLLVRLSVEVDSGYIRRLSRSSVVAPEQHAPEARPGHLGAGTLAAHEHHTRIAIESFRITP